jgi:hypothetical protein
MSLCSTPLPRDSPDERRGEGGWRGIGIRIAAAGPSSSERTNAANREARIVSWSWFVSVFGKKGKGAVLVVLVRKSLSLLEFLRKVCL